MTDTFEDRPPSGTGKPTRREAMDTRDYLRRRNRDYGLRPVMAELKANGFEFSFSTLQRLLKDEPGAPPTGRKSNKVANDTKDRAAAETIKDAACSKPPPEQQDVPVEKLIEEVIGPPNALKKNSEIALLENKTRMALSIILMRRLVASPELLLVEMRGAAALLEALNNSSRLSGGAAFEVLTPEDRPEIDGNGMKDITPVASIENFKRYRSGKGT
jgi:hypothetical protein